MSMSVHKVTIAVATDYSVLSNLVSKSVMRIEVTSPHSACPLYSLQVLSDSVDWKD